MNRKQRRIALKQGASAPGLPPRVQAAFDDAIQHHRSGRPDEAERLLLQVVAVAPRHADSLHVLGVIAYQGGHAERALELISRSVEINPRLASSQSNLGNLYQAEGRFAEAADCYRRAVELEPGFAMAENNLGNALRALGRLDQAIAAYRRCLGIAPNDPDAHYHLGMALLEQGDLAAGFKAYEWRWRSAQLGGTRRDFTQPQWRGEAGDGRTLLVHAEQGFGDTLQFCRYAPMAASRGWRVVVEAPKPLVRLLASLAAVDEVVAKGEAPPRFDLHCPMMSLPVALGTTLATVPGDTPYLHPDAALAEAWRARLDALGQLGPRVGLVWTGNTLKQNLGALDRRRAIASDRLAPLLQTKGLHFFSLQKDLQPPPELPLIDLMGEVEDFADTAALIANLDLVISVDTAVAHLAGALGKPVWVLNRFDACWRWMRGRDDSPWYPKLRQFRQPTPGDWDGAIAAARDALADWKNTGG